MAHRIAGRVPLSGSVLIKDIDFPKPLNQVYQVLTSKYKSLTRFKSISETNEAKGKNHSSISNSTTKLWKQILTKSVASFMYFLWWNTNRMFYCYTVLTSRKHWFHPKIYLMPQFLFSYKEVVVFGRANVCRKTAGRGRQRQDAKGNIS